MQWMILPLKRYADFRGRSRRKEYWMFILFLFIVYTVFTAGAIAMGVSAAAATSGGGALARLIGSLGMMFVVFGLFWLGTLIPSIAVAVRRLHDTNRSGWWLMAYVGPYILSLMLTGAAVGNGSAALQLAGAAASLVGLIAAVVLLVFFCLDGTRGPNRFGADPKGADLGDVFA